MMSLIGRETGRLMMVGTTSALMAYAFPPSWYLPGLLLMGMLWHLLAWGAGIDNSNVTSMPESSFPAAPGHVYGSRRAPGDTVIDFYLLPLTGRDVCRMIYVNSISNRMILTGLFLLVLSIVVFFLRDAIPFIEPGFLYLGGSALLATGAGFLLLYPIGEDAVRIQITIWEEPERAEFGMGLLFMLIMVSVISAVAILYGIVDLSLSAGLYSTQETLGIAFYFFAWLLFGGLFIYRWAARRRYTEILEVADDTFRRYMQRRLRLIQEGNKGYVL